MMKKVLCMILLLSLLCFSLCCIHRSDHKRFTGIEKSEFCSYNNYQIYNKSLLQRTSQYHDRPHTRIKKLCLKKKLIFVFVDNYLMEKSFINIKSFLENLFAHTNEIIQKKKYDCYPDEDETKRLYGLYLLSGFLSLSNLPANIQLSSSIGPMQIFCNPKFNNLHILHEILGKDVFEIFFTALDDYDKTRKIYASAKFAD